MKNRPNFLKALKRKTPMKIRVTPAISKELQMIALENGIDWTVPESKSCNLKMPYIFFDKWNLDCSKNKTYSITHAEDETFFNEDPNREYIPETDTLLPKPRKKSGNKYN